MNIEIQNRADTIEVVYIWSSLLQLTVKTRELTETEKKKLHQLNVESGYLFEAEKNNVVTVMM